MQYVIALCGGVMIFFSGAQLVQEGNMNTVIMMVGGAIVWAIGMCADVKRGE
jgi:hypothetical protein